MTKMERRKLLKLVRHFSKQSEKHDIWIKKNWHRCGHSEDADSLGDEGWMQGHRYGGRMDAYDSAALMLNDLIKTFKIIDGRKAAK